MLKQRIITALVLAPIVLTCIFLLSPEHFQYFVALVMFLGAWEWANLSGIQSQVARWGYALLLLASLPFVVLLFQVQPYALLLAAAVFWLLVAFWVKAYPQAAGLWSSKLGRCLMGVLVLLPTWQGLVLLKQLSPSGGLILILMLVVWSADIGAYFAGRRWGQHKLAPAVSPGKTLEGLYGGLLASLVVIVASGFYMLGVSLHSLSLFIFFGVITALASVLGDLLESMVKRQRGIKDSSQLLPGHGGVMDRIDSLTAAAPIFALGTSWLFAGL